MDESATRYTDQQLRSLAMDAEFQRLIATDREMDRLSSVPRRTRDDRIAEIALAMGGLAEIAAGVFLAPPTAGTMLLLATIESPYVLGGERKLIDVDVAAYTLNEGKEALGCGLSTEAVQLAAVEWAAGWAGSDAEVRARVDIVIIELVVAAFTALSLLPTIGQDSRRCLFDLPWLAWVSSTVASTTGHRADYVAWKMPLVLSMHYIVAERRRQGQEIIQQTPNELLIARMHEMMDAQIKARGYV